MRPSGGGWLGHGCGWWKSELATAATRRGGRGLLRCCHWLRAASTDVVRDATVELVRDGRGGGQHFQALVGGYLVAMRDAAGDAVNGINLAHLSTFPRCP